MVVKRNILIVDDEPTVLDFLRDAIEDYQGQFNIHTATSGEEALEILGSTKVDLVLTDLNMPQMNGFELIAYMSRNYKDVPIITMTGFGTPESLARAKQLGSLFCVEKPIQLDTLVGTIEEALETYSRGYIHGVTLSTFLQMVAQERKTCTLEVRSKGRVGHLHVKEGKLINAETGDMKGKEAAVEIILWDGPEIYMLNRCIRNDEYMDSSIIHMLLEASRVRDEQGPDLALSQGDELLGRAIMLAEGLHFRGAHKLLKKHLGIYPRSHQAWLYYSRIAGTMKSIEAALNNALLIAPTDPEVAEDTRKFEFAKERIEEDRVRRCPFCWSPVEESSSRCHYCNAHLSINKHLFKSKQPAKREILHEAIRRYKKVIAQEDNTLAYYYLGMAHLNLENWEEALSQLHKSVKIAPQKEYLSKQLHILLDYMASSAAVAEQTLSSLEADPDPIVAAPAESKKKRVLVVEDSSTTRKIISVTLSQEDYEVIEARDGLEALSRVNEIKPDLILLDILLPKMDGYKILSIVKSSPQLKDIPVVMLTSKDGFIDKVKGKLAGSAEYLTKPFDPKKLLETVGRYV